MARPSCIGAVRTALVIATTGMSGCVLATRGVELHLVNLRSTTVTTGLGEDANRIKSGETAVIPSPSTGNLFVETASGSYQVYELRYPPNDRRDLRTPTTRTTHRLFDASRDTVRLGIRDVSIDVLPATGTAGQDAGPPPPQPEGFPLRPLPTRID